MKIGVVFPQTEIGPNPADIKKYALAVENIGYHHLVVYDHVLGADPDAYSGWQGPYTYKHLFHEPFVLFGYLAAITSSLELVTGVLILPQRQTALVAKQAAEVDLISGGRLRLGIGIGWNPVEYDALGQDFHSRGRRSEEQISLLRALWTQETVSFTGNWDHVFHAGVNPLPIQRPIPIWIGGNAEPVLRRIGRLADGWIPAFNPSFSFEECRKEILRMHEYAKQAGRDPSSIGIEGRLGVVRSPKNLWRNQVSEWRELGATHIAVDTMGAGCSSVDEHISVLEEVYAAVSGELPDEHT